MNNYYTCSSSFSGEYNKVCDQIVESITDYILRFDCDALINIHCNIFPGVVILSGVVGQINKTIPYEEIVQYLNQKTGKNFKHTSKVTQRHIRARLAEGFTVSDFKQVIDNKCNDWLRDQKMKEYLRPETLFGTKFESYLNSKTTTTKQTGPYIDSCGLRVL